MSDRPIPAGSRAVSREVTAQIARPVVDLLREPDGPRDRQLLYGDTVEHLADVRGWAYVEAMKDGYRGCVPKESLAPAAQPTHWVHAAATHVYSAPDFKSPERTSLSLGSRLTVFEETEKFAETAIGFVPRVHLSLHGHHLSDPADVAALFLCTPYLWGGNSRWGIDCSGLVQAALLSCGFPCPGDSGMQQVLGHEVTEEGYARNDLLFWKGHVALVVDEERLIHANAGAMATVYEPIEAAIARIADQGDGPIVAHRRMEPTPPPG